MVQVKTRNRILVPQYVDHIHQFLVICVLQVDSAKNIDDLLIEYPLNKVVY